MNGFEQPQPSIGLSEQQQAAIAGDITARKPGLDLAAFYGWKVKADLGTFCHLITHNIQPRLQKLDYNRTYIESGS